MKKKTLVVFIITVLLSAGIIISGCGCKHEWVEATCTEPKTCSKCGETEGEALGHEWNDATCTLPKTCIRCGKTKGAAIGHDFSDWSILKEGNCIELGTEHRTCSRCDYEETRAIKGEHQYSDWTIEEAPTYERDGLEVRECVICGEKESQVVEKLVRGISSISDFVSTYNASVLSLTSGTDVTVSSSISVKNLQKDGILPIDNTFRFEFNQPAEGKLYSEKDIIKTVNLSTLESSKMDSTKAVVQIMAFVKAATPDLSAEEQASIAAYFLGMEESEPVIDGYDFMIITAGDLLLEQIKITD